MQYAKFRIISESKTNANIKQFTVDFIFVKLHKCKTLHLRSFTKLKQSQIFPDIHYHICLVITYFFFSLKISLNIRIHLRQIYIETDPTSRQTFSSVFPMIKTQMHSKLSDGHEISGKPCAKYRLKECMQKLSAHMQHNAVKVILLLFNPTALRKAKIAYNFGLSECNRVKKTRLSYQYADTLESE